MKGRRPVPAEQRADVADRSKRPARKPVVIGGRLEKVPPPPFRLSSAQAAIYRRKCAQLLEVKMLAGADLEQVALYARAVDRANMAARMIDRVGKKLEEVMLAATVRGTWTANPMLAVEREAMKEARQYAATLGFDPVARSRLGLKNRDRTTLGQMRDQAGAPGRARAAGERVGIRPVDADDDD